MSDNEFIIGLTAVALLGGYLIYMQWERAWKRGELRRQPQRESNGINVAPLRPRLEALRRDYAAAAHAHGRSSSARETLVVAARRKLGQLPFFRPPPAPHEGEHSADSCSGPE